MPMANPAPKSHHRSPPRPSRGAQALPLEVRRALGARVRGLRRAKGLSLEQVAALMEVSAGTLGGLERGKMMNPPLGTVLRLMAALDVPSIELLFGEPGYGSGQVAGLLSRP